ncbi:uncharacterized protein LOC126895136 isoform X2 [Daktulosphaira vitifoliae]|uniref:uncharacterized protein LOC126895136 isoform X2 n=1 Tax=Daktulosphaira vitifoliae TaxID=58002 RepID=UPI0021AA7FF1|nr:uncharacterized protein LOC126895136 isoform X2 [Daktulosphaira vitifoliae]
MELLTILNLLHSITFKSQKIYGIILSISLYTFVFFIFSIIGLIDNVKQSDINIDKMTNVIFIYMNYLCAAIKFITVLYYDEILSKIISVTFDDFFKSELCQTKISLLKEKIRKTQIMSFMYATAFCVVFISWMIVPIAANLYIHQHFNITTRLNCLNLFYPVSQLTYDKYYYIFYLNELIWAIWVIWMIVTFDSLNWSLCQIISTRYAIVFSAFAKLNTDNENKNNQRLNRYTKKFFTVIRPVILFQIANGTFSIVASTYFISAQLISNSINMYEFSKYFIVMIVMEVQVFQYTKCLNEIDIKRDSINFGIYSSNWMTSSTRMKKTLLQVMMINNANNLKIKATPEKMINLKFFLSMVKTSYSVVSVMLNVKFR